MKKILLTVLSLAVFTLGLTTYAYAKIGVGVGLGKIQIDEQLSPGGIYNLPSLPVLNTGDEAGDYEVEVTYLQDQPEFRPDGAWFSFNPQSFPLEPGASQLVDVKLTLPVDTRPGDYFAFLEAHPKARAEGVTIGVAAATKLNFTVKPRGILGAAAERVRSLIEANRPLVTGLAGIVAVLAVVSLGRKYLDIRVGIKKEKKEEE